jgi:DNA-directed RNA polymerase specialized sigma24 family protein
MTKAALRHARRQFDAQLAQLGPRQFQAMVLAFIGCTIAETAKAMQINQAAVKLHRKRARRKLGMSAAPRINGRPLSHRHQSPARKSK